MEYYPYLLHACVCVCVHTHVHVIHTALIESDMKISFKRNENSHNFLPSNIIPDNIER